MIDDIEGVISKISLLKERLRGDYVTRIDDDVIVDILEVLQESENELLNLKMDKVFRVRKNK